MERNEVRLGFDAWTSGLTALGRGGGLLHPVGDRLRRDYRIDQRIERCPSHGGPDHRQARERGRYTLRDARAEPATKNSKRASVVGSFSYMQLF